MYRFVSAEDGVEQETEWNRLNPVLWADYSRDGAYSINKHKGGMDRN